MKLKFDLEKEELNNLKLMPGEQIYYCLPFDIDDVGDFCEHSYFVMTQKRILILNNHNLTMQVFLKECDDIKSESLVNCGILTMTQDRNTILLGRFSAKHLVRFSYMQRGFQLLQRGENESVISKEYEKVCEKCGRALPGTRTCPKCLGKKQGFLHEILHMIKPHKAMLILILFFMALATIITLINPVIQRYLVDNVLTSDHRRATVAAVCIGLMFLCNVGIAIVNAVKSYLCSKLGSTISENLRQKLFRKIQTLSISFIDDSTPGELMNRIIQDTNRVKDFMGDTFCNMFTVSILFVADLVIMLCLNWKLALISYLFTPVAIVTAFGIRKNIRIRFHRQWEKSDDVNGNLQDVISGMAVVKSFGQERKEAKRFARDTEDFARIQTSNERFFAIVYPMISFVLGVGIYLVIYFGGSRVLNQNMTTGELLQFVNYVSLFYTYIGWMTNMPRMFMNMVTSVERINDILQQEPTIYDRENAVSHKVVGDFEMKHASFGYKSYQPVLEDINLQIHQGEMIGIVGASGTGKSTMINLIMHLYEVDDGDIFVDKKNIKDIRLSDYHAQIGVVLQETFLFSGTILNNLRFVKADANYEDIIRAAKIANAHDFICKMPDGYDTKVGEHGYNLSGGERQRIAIARAVLADPKILILDEATASLDTESEYMIQNAFARITKNRTCFAIAHRLSTLKNADRLLVIDGHHIAEIGTHQELMQNKGIYYKLVNAQNVNLDSQLEKEEDYVC